MVWFLLTRQIFYCRYWQLPVILWRWPVEHLRSLCSDQYMLPLGHVIYRHNVSFHSYKNEYTQQVHPPQILDGLTEEIMIGPDRGNAYPSKHLCLVTARILVSFLITTSAWTRILIQLFSLILCRTLKSKSNLSSRHPKTKTYMLLFPLVWTTVTLTTHLI